MYIIIIIIILTPCFLCFNVWKDWHWYTRGAGSRVGVGGLHLGLAALVGRSESLEAVYSVGVVETVPAHRRSHKRARFRIALRDSAGC